MFLEKLRSWIPNHFRNEGFSIYIEALASILEDSRTQANNLAQQTYISESNSDFLNFHGQERNLRRVNYGTVDSPLLEVDQAFQNRVRRIKYTRTKQNIIDNVFSVTGVIDLDIVNDFEEETNFFSGLMDKRASTVTINETEYGNYGPLDLNLRQNCFSVIINTEDRIPLSFFDSEYFFDNGEAFYDTRDRVFDENTIEIIKTLTKAKAPAGSGFRILVKGFTGLSLGDESSQEEDLNSIQ